MTMLDRFSSGDPICACDTFTRMARGKKPSTPATASAVSRDEIRDALLAQKALIEEMRSENRLTAESVGAKVDTLAQQLDEGLREARERDAMLERAIRDVRISLKADIDRVETKV